jgi:DNA-binding CsgD family transcriptional regulator
MLGEGVLHMVGVLGGGARVLLVLEDLQWADPESLTVLEYLVDHAGDGLLDCVATARLDPSPGLTLARDLQARRAATVLEVPPLPDPAVASMALECLGGSTLPAGVNDVLARADGLPFLVEELLSAAVDANGLIRRRDEWIVRSIASSVVPHSLADSVALRVRALDEADRDVPGAAAVLGRRFDLPLLRSMTGLSARGLRTVLDRCIELQLMTVDTEGYQFRHALTRDAVLAGLAPDARTAMAGAARAVLAEVHPGLPGQWCELAAELSALAGEPDDAAAQLLEVGRRAVASGALATAADALARAGELVADDAELVVEIDEVRIEIAALSGTFEKALEIGSGLLLRLSDPARRAEVHVRIAQAASATASWVAAQEHVTLARDLVADIDPAALAGVDALAAHVLLGAAQPEAAEATARRALDAAERTDLSDTACQALEVIGRVARKRDLHEAEAAFTRQLEIATTHGMTVWMLRATHELGAVDLMGSNRVDRLVRARELAAEAGALSVMATVDLQLAGSGVVSLDAAGCLAAAQRCQLAARRWHLDLVLAVALLFEAWAHAIASRRSAMELALAEAASVGRPEVQIPATTSACRATFWLLREERDRAMAAYDTAMSALRAVPDADPGSYCSEWALLRTVQNLDGDRARDEMRQLLPTGGFRSEALLGYGDAIAAGRRGSTREAEALFATAQAKISAGHGWESLRHLAERLVAECALADGWGQPIDWLTEAGTYFRNTRFEHVERACRSLLRRAGARSPGRVYGHQHVPAALAAIGITDREADVLALLADGLTSKQIGSRLFISARTVDKHVERLLAKTGTTRRAELPTFLT